MISSLQKYKEVSNESLETQVIYYSSLMLEECSLHQSNVILLTNKQQKRYCVHKDESTRTRRNITINKTLNASCSAINVFCSVSQGSGIGF